MEEIINNSHEMDIPNTETCEVFDSGICEIQSHDGSSEIYNLEKNTDSMEKPKVEIEEPSIVELSEIIPNEIAPQPLTMPEKVKTPEINKVVEPVTVESVPPVDCNSAAKKPNAIPSNKRKSENNIESNIEEKKNYSMRKNLRGVINENNFDTITITAQREESERLARVQELKKSVKQRYAHTTLEAMLQDLPYEGGPRREKYPPSCETQTLSQLNKRSTFDLIDNKLHRVDVGRSEKKLWNQWFSSERSTAPPEDKGEVVTIDSSSSEDECIVLSDSDDCMDDHPEDDHHNSGLHVRDVLNIPNEHGKVLVNVGHVEGEPDIFVAPQIAKVIKPHQIGGVRFLFDNIIESTKRFNNSSGFGCILAHSMGLGKTLQVVCFSDIFLRHTDAKTILCVMPINTIQNWVKEFNLWIPEESPNPDEVRPRQFKVFALNDQHKTMSARANVIFRWYTQGGVLLIGYELFRVLGLKIMKRKEGKKNLENSEHKRLMDQIHMALVKPGPDLVICDEGHRIKNAHAGISIALKQIRSRRRIVLTGYPLQNNLLEYWCMVDFVRPNYLGSKTEFCNMFERPIQNGQCVDSTPEDIKLMRYRAHVLHSLLVGFVQRRSDSVLQSSLPQKLEYVILTKMTTLQRNLYDAFMNEVVRKKKVPNPLKAFAVCCKIWNHPDVLYNFLKKRESECDLEIDEPSTPNDKSTKDEIPPKEYVNTADNTFANDPIHTNCADPTTAVAQPPKPDYAGATALASPIIDLDTKDVQFIKSDVITDVDVGATPSASNFKQAKLDVDTTLNNIKMAKNLPNDSISYDWALNLVKNYEPGLVSSSPKMEVFLYILQESVKLGDRVLLFSQSLLTLNLMELFLQRSVIADSQNHWKKNVTYFRLDGSTSALEREKLVNEFNNNRDVKLFLISTRAGSLGINLTGANRVVVFDASWNPCHDTQAVHRVYRYGQRKSCFVYRIVMDSCLEKNIYDRQVKKQGMSDRVVDECNPDAHLSIRELTNLCYDRVEETQCDEFKQPLDNFSDVVIRQVITNYKSILSKEPFYHESLLIDRKEKKLSQTEKKLAKRGYEIEKKASIKPNFMAHNSDYKIMQNRDCMLNQVIPRVPPFKKIIREPLRNPGMKLTRWIPAEVWQRQGMSSQEMKLPIDVAIPTSSSESSSIVVKAGEKVMVLKSPKGVYMQLESGKIIAIKTSSEAAQEREKVKAKKISLSELIEKKSINPMERIELKEVDRPNRCHARMERSSTESDKDDVIVINDSINDSVETPFDSSYSKQKSRTVDLIPSKAESRASLLRNRKINNNMTATATTKAPETSFDLSYSKHKNRPDINPSKEDSARQHFRNKNDFPSSELRTEKQDTPTLQAHQKYIHLPETEPSPLSYHLEQPPHNNYFGSTPTSSNYGNLPPHNMQTPQYSIPTIETNRWKTKSPDAPKQKFKISNIPAPYPSTAIFDKNETPQTQPVNDILNVDQYTSSYTQSCKESEDYAFHHTHNLNMNSNYYNNSSLSTTPCVEDNGSYNALYQYNNKNESSYTETMYENSNSSHSNYHEHMSKYSYGYYQPEYLPNYNDKMYDSNAYSSQYYMKRPSNYPTNATNAVDVGLNYAEPQGWVKNHLPD